MHNRDGTDVTSLSACYASADIPMPDEKHLQPTPSPRGQRTPTENEQFWLLPGDLGTTQIFTGTLAMADDNSAILLVQMSGLGPGSPSSSSRSVQMTLICEEGHNEAVRWYYEPFTYSRPEKHSPELACHEGASMYFTYDDPYHRVVISSAETSLHYTITAEIHSPY
jgi:hypothetical protein